MEHFESRVADADIVIDYHTKEIKFENKVMKSHPVIGVIKLVLIIFGALSLLFAQMYFTKTFPYTVYNSSTGEPIIYETVWDYYTPMFLPLFSISIFFVILLTFTDIWSSGNIPWLRDIMLNKRRKRSHNFVEIQNPSGTIIYQFVGSGSPLIDIEYNDDIAEVLVESSLMKKKEERKYFNFLKYTRNYMVLKIVLSRPAVGNLKIFEY